MFRRIPVGVLVVATLAVMVFGLASPAWAGSSPFYGRPGAGSGAGWPGGYPPPDFIFFTPGAGVTTFNLNFGDCCVGTIPGWGPLPADWTGGGTNDICDGPAPGNDSMGSASGDASAGSGLGYEQLAGLAYWGSGLTYGPPVVSLDASGNVIYHQPWAAALVGGATPDGQEADKTGEKPGAEGEPSDIVKFDLGHAHFAHGEIFSPTPGRPLLPGSFSAETALDMARVHRFDEGRHRKLAQEERDKAKRYQADAEANVDGRALILERDAAYHLKLADISEKKADEYAKKAERYEQLDRDRKLPEDQRRRAIEERQRRAAELRAQANQKRELHKAYWQSGTEFHLILGSLGLTREQYESLMADAHQLDYQAGLLERDARLIEDTLGGVLPAIWVDGQKMRWDPKRNEYVPDLTATVDLSEDRALDAPPTMTLQWGTLRWDPELKQYVFDPLGTADKAGDGKEPTLRGPVGPDGKPIVYVPLDPRYVHDVFLPFLPDRQEADKAAEKAEAERQADPNSAEAEDEAQQLLRIKPDFHMHTDSGSLMSSAWYANWKTGRATHRAKTAADRTVSYFRRPEWCPKYPEEVREEADEARAAAEDAQKAADAAQRAAEESRRRAEEADTDEARQEAESDEEAARLAQEEARDADEHARRADYWAKQARSPAWQANDAAQAARARASIAAEYAAWGLRDTRPGIGSTAGYVRQRADEARAAAEDAQKAADAAQRAAEESRRRAEEADTDEARKEAEIADHGARRAQEAAQEADQHAQRAEEAAKEAEELVKR